MGAGTQSALVAQGMVQTTHGAKTHHSKPPFCHPKDDGDPQCPVGGILPGHNGTITGRCLESLREAARC